MSARLCASCGEADCARAWTHDLTRRQLLQGAGAFALGTFMVVGLPACGSGGSGNSGSGGSGGGRSGGVATMAIFGSIGPSLLPNFTNSGRARAVTECFNSSLLRFDSGGEFVPLLAESYDLAADGGEYTFHLRQGVTWSDGEPFTAHDVEAAVLAMTDPVTVTNWISYVQTIQGAADRKAGTSTELPGVEVVDDHTIRILLEHPAADFLDLFGTQFQPLPKHIVDTIPIEELTKGEFGQKPDVTLGAFYPVNRSGDDSIELARNERFWDGEVPLERMIIKTMTSTTAVPSLISGELDVVPGEAVAELGQNDAKQLESNNTITVTTYPNNTTQTLYLNTRTLFGDVRVRKAVLYALDRAAIIDAVLGGEGVVADSVYPDFSPYFNADAITTYTQDVDQARALLQDAGWDSATVANFVVPTGDSTVEQAGVIIQQQLAEIGMQAEIEQVDHNTGVTRLLQEHSFDLAVFSNVGLNNLDVSRRFATESYDGGVNAGGYSNPELDQIMAEALTKATLEEQRPLTDQIQKIISDDVPTVMLYYRHSIAAVNTGKLSGVTPQRGGAWLNNHEWRVA